MHYILVVIRNTLRKIDKLASRCFVRNKNVTIISNDCVGGALYHFLGLQFKSPTINLFMSSDGFLLFCQNLNEYIFNSKLVESKSNNFSFPIGLLVPNSGLKSLKIYFKHYESFEKAKEKWFERCKRVSLDNIFIVGNFYHSTNTDLSLVNGFNELAYQKIFFVRKKEGFKEEYILKDINVLVLNYSRRYRIRFPYEHGRVIRKINRAKKNV